MFKTQENGGVVQKRTIDKAHINMVKSGNSPSNASEIDKLIDETEQVLRSSKKAILEAKKVFEVN